MKKSRSLYRFMILLAGWSLAGTPQAANEPSAGYGGPSERPRVVLPPDRVLYSQNAYKIPYLGLDGVFTLDPAETVPFEDPRNPKRILFEKMEYASFYEDESGEIPLASNCRYIYRGAAGDPYYFYTADPPAKTSIWDLFELVGGEDACLTFSYLIVRPPHGDPAHMHLRYGGKHSGFWRLLANSTGPEDTTKRNPWWSVYCAEGVTACD